MHESKRDMYILLIECYLMEDAEKNGISFTHAAAKEILELLEQTDKKSGRCMIDNEEIVRCKNCMNNENWQGFEYCAKLGRAVDGDDYCCWGVRGTCDERNKNNG